MTESTKVSIDPKYWDQDASRWKTHEAFETIAHEHVCHYAMSDEESCDLMIVKCANGKWYIEDTWGDEAPGYDDVLDVHNRKSVATMMSENDVRERAQQIVDVICNQNRT